MRFVLFFILFNFFAHEHACGNRTEPATYTVVSVEPKEKDAAVDGDGAKAA